MAYLTAENLPPPVVVGNGYAAGCTAYNFSAPDQNGRQVSLYANFGRYIVLEYCTFSCPVCASIAPAVAQAVTTMSNNDYPVLHMTVLLKGPNGVSATQEHAAWWATKYNLTSPVLHPGGAAMDGSEQGTDFMNYSIAGLGGPGVPTFVFLSPVLKILLVKVGTRSLTGSDFQMTADQIYKVMYNDVRANPLHATWELRTLTKSFPIREAVFTLMDQCLGYAITALMKPIPDKQDAINQIKLYQKIMGDNVGSTTSDISLRLNNKANLILTMLGYRWGN